MKFSALLIHKAIPYAGKLARVCSRNSGYNDKDIKPRNVEKYLDPIHQYNSL